MQGPRSLLTRLLPIAGAGLLMSACATHSSEIAAGHTPLSKFERMDCEQLAEQRTRLSLQIKSLSAAIDESRGGDRFAMGVGVVFWPALFLIDGKGDKLDELARLKGDLESVQDNQDIKGCLIPQQKVQELPGTAPQASHSVHR